MGKEALTVELSDQTALHAVLHRLITGAGFLTLALFAAAGAWAQTPAALPQLDVATSRNWQLLKSVAVDGKGVLTLVWAQGLLDGGDLARGRRFSAGDVALGPDIVLDRTVSYPAEVVANQRGDTIAIWNRPLSGGAIEGVLRRESPTLRRLTLRWSHPVGDVSIDQAGNFVVVWTAQTAAGSRVLGQRYNADGCRRGPEFNAATTLDGAQVLGGVGMNHRTGEFVIVWQKSGLDGSNRRILAQRFGFSTGRHGREFLVSSATFEAGHSLVVDVGRAEDGSFVVAWTTQLRFPDRTADIAAQRFTNLGAKDGDEITVAEDARISTGYMRLAVAPQGQFAVAWDDSGPPLFVRLYRRDGTPAGAAREVGRPGVPFGAEMAFGWNGTLVVGWTDYIGIHEPDDDTWEVNFQRFAAAPGVEFCAFHNGRFRCDTNGGGAPEVDHAFSISAGTPLLGDVDGDGRDDYCLFRDSRFDCDSGHDHGAAEFTALFGQTGDMPLLGDLDGDGRDEACVSRSGHFLCDAGHDGGTAELDIAFGQAGGIALLGDVDGDGRDEPCLAFADEFRCDTSRNGGSAETILQFSLGPGLVPLLADVDSDGQDEPCGAGNGAFLCDIARDGGAFDFFLSIENSPGTPLIGNLDGV